MIKYDVIRFLKENDDYLIVTHGDPDPDTLGSAVALAAGLRKVGKRVNAICEKLPDKFTFIDQKEIFIEKIPETVKNIICVDTASPKMLEYANEFIEKHGISLVIDHHKINTLDCGRKYIKSGFSSCGEVVYGILKILGVTIDRDMATALYAAVSSDSGCFKFAGTRPETMFCAAELMKCGIDFAKINRCLFDMKTQEQIALERIAYNSIELMCGGKLSVVTITQEDLKNSGAEESDIDGLNQIPRRIKGVEVSVLLRPKSGIIKVSLRSNEYFDVAGFASKRFGGGGHKHAAGCSFECDLQTAKDKIIDALKEELQKDA